MLTDSNEFQTVRIGEVSKKIIHNRFTMVAVDRDNNAIGKSTTVKIVDPESPYKGQIGEIRSLYKNKLFLWIRNPKLSDSKGFHCVSSFQVVNAGA